MEQSSFLSSVPFLVPLHTKAWPPKHNPKRVLNDEFEPYVFAVESVVDDSAPSLEGESIAKPRPLYFAEQTDPTLSPIQIYIGSPDDDLEKQHFYFRTGDFVYMVDAQKAKTITIQGEWLATNDDGAEEPSTTAKQEVKLPPSLVIRFSTCQFRIFRNRLLHCQHDKEALRSAGALLLQASLAPFVVPRHVMASPARTFASSSSNNSHRKESSSSTNTSYTTDVPASNNNNDEDKKRSANDAGIDDEYDSLEGNDERGRIERCLKSRKYFHDRLSLIAHGLRYFVANPLEAPSALLSHTADCWANSYISTAEFITSQRDDSAAATNQEKMDAVLTNFFPDRSAGHGIAKAPSTPQEATRAIQELLRGRKELHKKQCEVLLLPVRG